MPQASPKIAECTVHIDAAGGDAEELEALTQQLRSEIAELDVDSVEPAPGGPAPAGAKAVGLLAIGSLLVKFLASEKVFSKLIEVVTAWLQRSGQRSVVIELGGDKLEVKGISGAEQKRLIDEFIRRHAAITIANG